MNKLFVALFPLLASCATAITPLQADEDDLEPAPWIQDPEVLQCAPSSIGPSSQLVLTLGAGHGKELAIRNMTDGIWYFLVVDSPPDDMKSLMTPKQFQAATRVVIPAGITGYAWAAYRSNERVFTNSGTYTVYTSDVLESEVGGYMCNVAFTRDAR